MTSTSEAAAPSGEQRPTSEDRRPGATPSSLYDDDLLDDMRPLPPPRTDRASSRAPGPDAGLGSGNAEETPIEDLVDDTMAQVRQVRRSMNRGFQRLADQLEDLAGQLEQVAETQLKPLGADHRAVGIARSGADLLGDAADYLRTRDLRGVRDDLENRVRVRPVPTLLLTLGAGWVLGKIMR